MELFFLILLVGIVIFWWIKIGNKGKKLFQEIEQELTTNYGWSSDKALFVWKKFNKKIVNMQFDGLSSEEIAEKLNEKFNNTHSEN
ncbi:hypothetical protein [Fodinibius sp. SL11]|uniref:hypothetical protein n=1 Tax=Fodinibius sp. SL11 TaxID=3425690 RepID=UPI003F884755